MRARQDIVVESGFPATPLGRNTVAIIGIDRYRSCTPLNNAVNDANAIRSLLGQLGFEEVTPPLLDEMATGLAIMSLVTDDLTKLDENDSLILFFAGHGRTQLRRMQNSEVCQGYLIPVDGAQKVATWVELEQWLRSVSTLPPRHILVILDACFAGSALKHIIRRGRDASTAQRESLDTLHAKRSRQIITSTLDDQIALDAGPIAGHSLFMSCLLEGLREARVDNYPHRGGCVSTGSDLGRYLRKRMIEWPGAERYGPRQIPDFGCLDYDERGEMLIPLLRSANAQAEAAARAQEEAAAKARAQAAARAQEEAAAKTRAQAAASAQEEAAAKARAQAAARAQEEAAAKARAQAAARVQEEAAAKARTEAAKARAQAAVRAHKAAVVASVVSGCVGTIIVMITAFCMGGGTPLEVVGVSIVAGGLPGAVAGICMRFPRGARLHRKRIFIAVVFGVGTMIFFFVATTASGESAERAFGIALVSTPFGTMVGSLLSLGSRSPYEHPKVRS